MRSLRLGSVFGIPVELHYTFVLGAVFVVLGLLLLSFLGVFPFTGFFPSLLFIFFLFLSVFFHELVHCIVLIEKGFKVERIVLLPIGGISFSEELPDKPSDEFQVSIAGPLFNFFVAAAIVLLAWMFNAPLHLSKLLGEGSFFAIVEEPLLSLFYINLVLGLFNLFFPALPLDGGRVARSLIACFVGWRAATKVVSNISVLLAAMLLLWGFMTGNVLIAVIALFVFFGSQQENQFVEMKDVLSKASVVPLLEKSPPVLGENTTLEELFELMVKENRLAFLVELNGGFGLVSFEALERVPREEWQNIRVQQVAQRLPAVSLKSNAAKLMGKALTKGYPLFPVMHRGRLIGVIYTRDLQKLYELEKLKEKASYG